MSIQFPRLDERVLARRDEIIAGLRPLVAPEALIVSEDERRAFETDALTAYRKMPLAVVLPSTTEEVSAVLKFCHEHGVKVVPRGAGTSLACRLASRISPSAKRFHPRASSTRPIRRASSPARSRATSP